MKKNLFILISIALLLTVLSGCSGNKLIGKWSAEVEGEALVIEFNKNGTYNLGTLEEHAKWEMDKDKADTLILTNMANDSYKEKVSIHYVDDNTLEMELLGDKLLFTRIK